MSHNRRTAICLLVSLVVAFAGLLWAPAVSRAQTTSLALETEPEISAKAAIVVEYPSGLVLYQKNAHDHLPPASTTKIMTAILALEYGKLSDVVKITGKDLVGESSMGLKEGEDQTLLDLLYGMLLPSGNDAAMALGRTLGAKQDSKDPALADPMARFVAMMNIRVSQLGLADTHFVNPHGLDTDGHYSSAYDLASMTWYAFHYPVFNEIISEVTHETPGHSLLNTNELLTRYPDADGVKTGLTDNAGLCLVGSATRNGHRLISVVLNAPKWYVDTAAILDYGFARLATGQAYTGGEMLSVTKRGVVAGLLANPPSLPALPVAPAPAQGGGAPAVAQVGNSGGGRAPSSTLSGLSLAPAMSNRPPDMSMGELLLFALGGFGAVALLYLVVERLVGVRVRFRQMAHGRQVAAAGAGAGAGAIAMPGGRMASVREVEIEPHHPTPRRLHALPPMPIARTLGTSGAASPSGVRRHEPNLLLTGAQQLEIHLERAIKLGWEGREGSSMAEFLLALRLADFDVADVAGAYQLSPTGFLALARAQMALGRMEEAQKTLIHGCTVLPNEPFLRLALYQLNKAYA